MKNNQTVRNKNYNLVIIILIASLSIFLRFYDITFQSYWLDELFSAKASNPDNSFKFMYHMTVSDVHPPLYQSLLWVWYKIFGFNEYSGRILSAIFGTISIYFMYLLGKVLFNKDVGLYASIISSTNYFLVYYSQEMRSYSLVFLLTTISYLYLIKIIQNYSIKNFIIYLISTIALLYTHYFAFFLVSTQFFVFIFFYFKEKNNRKQLLILSVITSIVFLIALVPLMTYILNNVNKSSWWAEAPSIIFFIKYFNFYIRSLPLDIIFTFLIIFGIKKELTVKGWNTDKSALIVIVIWIVIGYLLPYIRSILSTPLLIPRNTIIVLPAIILFISYSISTIKNVNAKKSIITLITILSIFTLYIKHYNTQDVKDEWREILYSINHINKKLPVYDPVYNGVFYKTYAEMLKLDLNIYHIKNLIKEKQEDKIPNCFWVVEAHGEWIDKINLLKDKSFHIVKKIEKNGTKAILYSYNVDDSICMIK